MIFRYFRISRQKGGGEQKNHVSVLSKLLGPGCPQKRGFYVISIKVTQNEHSGKKEGHYNNKKVRIAVSLDIMQPPLSEMYCNIWKLTLF